MMVSSTVPARLVFSYLLFAACAHSAVLQFEKFDSFDPSLWKDPQAIIRLVDHMKSKEQPLSDSPPCNTTKCKLPNCFCSGWAVPGSLPVKQVPQMIVFSFQYNLNDVNLPAYSRLFAGRSNPNRCPAVGTFFVSHTDTDYYDVQSLYSAGHEIGDNTVDTGNPGTWSSRDWQQQAASQKTILSRFGNIPPADIRGFRAPMLQPGGDDMIKGLQAAGLAYDSSRTTVKYRKPPQMMWPYTYDYQSKQDCPVPKCPKEAHPGFWEVPIPAIEDKQGTAWPSLGSLAVKTEQEVFDLLMKRFGQAYSGTRAPLTLVADAAFMMTSFKLAGTIKFLDSIQRLYKDVYIVSAWHVIEWMKNPTEVSKLADFGPWKCDNLPRPICSKDKVTTCWYDNKRKLVQPGKGQQIHRLRTCNPACSPCYPAVNDPEGKSC